MKTSLQAQRAAVLASITLFLAGCATAPNGGPAGAVHVDEDPCSVTQSALAGAAVGAILGALADGKKGAARGAVLGGSIGAAACYAVNVQSRQTKSAAQVDREYRRRQGALPPEPVVVSYASRISSPTVRRGQPVQISSVVELTNGAVRPVYSVREELAVFNPEGMQINPDPASKNFMASSGGRFENSFELKLPQNVSQGTYGLKTNLYVNDRLVGTRDLRTQLVWNGSTGELVALK